MSFIFGLTGVIEPDLDTDAIAQRADAHASLGAAAATCHTDVSAAVDTVLQSNDGPAAVAFGTKVAGPSGIVSHIDEVSDAGARTSAAYRAAGVHGAAVQLVMKTLASVRERQLRRMMFPFPRAVHINALVNKTREDLRQLEADGVQRITAAFANLALPMDFVPTWGSDNDGRLDVGIAEAWRSDDLTDTERQEILQAMADDYADANGIPRITIVFESIPSDPGTITLGGYNYVTGVLRLNLDALGDPRLLGTVIHEMQHRGQYEGTNSVPASRWEPINTDDVRSRGGSTKEEYYLPRPVEVDARRAERFYIDNMTYEEFEQAYL